MLASSVFGAAPRALAGVINLQQTVDLVRLSIEVVESNIDDIVEPEDAADVHAAVLRYAREVAFATAEVYARAAEVRGAWDARLEALVVDAVLRAETDEAVLSRASALGWSAPGEVAVVLGAVPGRADATPTSSTRYDASPGPRGWTRCAPPRASGWSWCSAASATRTRRRRRWSSSSATVRSSSARSRRASAGPTSRPAPRCRRTGRPPAGPTRRDRCSSDDLLPERALAGDGHARRHLVEEIYLPLVRAKGTLIETLAAYFEHGSSLEGAARALFVHPNTVRYRLRQVAELTGYTPTMPRHAFTLEIALVLGRQSGRTDADPPELDGSARRL